MTRTFLGAALLAATLPGLAAQVVVPAGATMTLPSGTLALACADLTVQGALSLGSATVGPAGSVSIPVGGSIAAGTAVLTVGGNWAKAGAFSRGTGTVTFTDGCASSPAVITGQNAFHNLNLTSTTGRTIALPAGSSVSVAGNLLVSGAGGPAIQLLSGTDGQAARISLASGATSSVVNANLGAGVTIVAFSSSTVDLSIAQTPSANPGGTGKDLVYALTVTNAGPAAATQVTLVDATPGIASFIWASPGCANASGTVTCNLGTIASGASAVVKLVVRPTAAAPAVNVASVSSNEADGDASNNAATSTVTVNASAAGVATQRYRLFSPVTSEHLYTTDLNEYNVLGSFVGTWIQEGPVGKVFNNPGSFNGVAATPYYRLYNTSNLQHHWTTDPNEYYLLGLFPQYNSEGVDGYIFPTQAAGTIPLYRLLYPFSVPVSGLHHWTIDAAEYNALIASFGWIGEGGSGFVIP